MNSFRKSMSTFRQSWKKIKTTHPRFAWAMSAMVWLPAGIAFNEYFYSLKYVAGRSMQVRQIVECSVAVRILTWEAASPRSIPMIRHGKILSSLTISQ